MSPNPKVGNISVHFCFLLHNEKELAKISVLNGSDWQLWGNFKSVPTFPHNFQIPIHISNNNKHLDSL